MMKYIKIFLGCFALGIFCAFIYATLNKAQSEETFPPDLLRTQMVPVYCGNSYAVLLTTMNTFGMQFLGSSDVRTQGQDDGTLLGTMSMWYNTNSKKGVFYLTIPASGETCLMSYGIDWTFDTELLLNIVNDSLANVSKLPDIEVEQKTWQGATERERMTPKQFALVIEKRASQKRISHMDAVLDYCKEKEIEPEQVTHLINRNLKDKIKMNAQDLNFLPKTATLPVQMNEGYEAYKKYLGIKLHFTKNEYDFFKYNSKTNAKFETFIKRNDKYFFVKAARKYGDNIVDYFVSNIISNKSHYIKDMNNEVYLDRQKRIDGLSYYFERDIEQLLRKSENNFNKIFAVTRGQHPILIKTYLAKRVSLETLCILNDLFNYTQQFSKRIKDDIIWPTLKNKIVKYGPFMTYSKERMKLILRKKVQ